MELTQNLSEPDYVPYAYFNAQRDSDLRNAGYTPTPYGWKRNDKTTTAPLPQPDASDSKEYKRENLGGACWDKGEKRWVSCYHVEENGRISTDSPYPKRAAETHHTQENVPWPEAAIMVAQLGRAVGRLFLTHCDVTEMSGFFVGPDHFLTCAHFSPGNGIEDQMKEPGSKVARVSIFRVPSETESPHFHLIFRDEDKDFALFARNPLEGKDVGQGQIDVDRLIDASLSSFSDVFVE